MPNIKNEPIGLRAGESKVMVSKHHRSTAVAARPAPDLVPPRRTGRVEELEAQIEKLRERLRLAVIYGGDKSQEGAVIQQTFNPRSWKSYRAVAQDIAESLKRIGFDHVSLVADDMRVIDFLKREAIDLAWLNTGGVQGYNPMSHAAAMLEMCGVPYLGHDPLTVGTLDNKDAFKRDLIYLGFPTAPFMTWTLTRGPFRPKVNSRFIRTFKDYVGPFVVKPVSGRASLHVHLVEDEDSLAEAVASVYEATENHVMIEAYLPGREYCIAVSGRVVAKGGRISRLSDPFAFAAVERVLDPDEQIFTSMDVRPISADRVRMLDTDADADVLAQLQELARGVFVEMNLESLVRLDVRADAHGKLNILEANPKADLKAPTQDQTSIICAALPSHDMDYDDLILSLLADRIDLLLSQRRGMVTRWTTLLG